MENNQRQKIADTLYEMYLYTDSEEYHIDQIEKLVLDGQFRVVEQMLSDLPDAVFVPDNATPEANALGIGFARYRLEVQTQLINKRDKLLAEIKKRRTH